MHVEFCATCGKSIGVEQGQISYEDQHWHATDECFSCATCAKSLRGGLMFIPKHGVIYCSNACLKYKACQPSDQTAANSIVGSYLNTPQIKLNLIQQQQKQQSPLCSPLTRGLATNGRSDSSAVGSVHSTQHRPLGNSSPSYANNYGEVASLDKQLAGALTNQSRSRKPFTYPSSSDYDQMAQQQQQQQQLQSPPSINIHQVPTKNNQVLKVIFGKLGLQHIESSLEHILNFSKKKNFK